MTCTCAAGRPRCDACRSYKPQRSRPYTYWDRESILAVVGPWVKTHGELRWEDLTPHNDLPHGRTILRYFKDLNELRNALGLPKGFSGHGGFRGYPVPLITKEDVRDAIQRFVGRHGRLPTTPDFTPRSGLPSTSTVHNFYDTLDAARLDALGDDYAKFFTHPRSRGGTDRPAESGPESRDHQAGLEPTETARL